MRALVIALAFLPIAAYAQSDDDETDTARRCSDCWSSPSRHHDDAYHAQEAFPGADFAPVYDSHGRRVGTIVTGPGGTKFEDNRGQRFP